MKENKKDKEKLRKIAQKYRLRLLLLFGSRASKAKKKFLHKESDFDVAYLAERDLDLMEEAKLICDLMPVFKSENIDLANIKKAGPLLMRQIFKNHKILICKNLQVYYQYKIYAERKYDEADPLFQLQENLIKNFLKKHA